MPINQLHIQQFRAIDELTIRCRPYLNIIIGANGSGKTSVLEAIYYLSLLKSFRPSKQGTPIQNGQSKCSSFVLLDDDTRIGFEIHRNQYKRCHVNGANYQSRAQLAALLPVQLFNSDTFQLFEGSPDWRRRFMDWGMFHVEHHFLSIWRQYQSLLKQRNALLKQTNIDLNEVKIWDDQLIEAAENITKLRYQYLEKLEKEVQQLALKINYQNHIQLVLDPGWKDNLREQLNNYIASDFKFGYTQCGAHRADLTIYINQKPAVEKLSRGQQKLLVIMIKAAQACLYQKHLHARSILLLDDIVSELDQDNLKLAISVLDASESQVFITAITPEPIIEFCSKRDPDADYGLCQLSHYSLY